MSLNKRNVITLIIICVLTVTPEGQGTLQLVDDCLSTIGDIPGCVEEVITSFLTLQITIGPQCCKALLDVEDNCWSQVFPLITSTFPLCLRSFCTRSNWYNVKAQSLSARYSSFSPAPGSGVEDVPTMSSGMDA
ncbi:hypothetical protein POM88_043735 [Heracleum sosnowskyi]|uniref:Prolamin-like domain-containing protein n=1 Tax=Heracleum sosnowskyi TaxID=360622 RepID=A0AAD8H467_9APIA|nr:hypothetical protein POM88_043735 [Heracleum sosnowskyi]